MFDIGNKHYEFFDMLNQQAKYFYEGAKILCNVMEDYEIAKTKIAEIRDIEHKADKVSADTIHRLNQIFITPIDREDILELSYGLENGMDDIQGCLERVIMYETGQPKTDGPIKLANLLIQTTEELVKATALLRNIRANQADIFESINRISTYETEGDTLYRKEMTILFKTEKDTVSIIKWKDILQCLEDTIDQTKHISDTLEGVVMKYA